MQSCQLGLTLSVVGTRAALLDMPLWPMALRVTVGTADDPGTTGGGASALVHDTLPWNLWSGDLPDIVLVDQTGAQVATCPAESPLAEDADFLEQLKTSVESAGRALASAGHLALAYSGEYEEVVDEDGGPGTPRTAAHPVAWPGLLMTINTLASPTPSAAKCTWYFYMKRDVVAQQGANGWELKPGIEISAAPLTVNGATHQRRALVDPAVPPTKFGTHRHEYDQAAVIAYCQALRISSVLVHDLDELDNYWLSIADSRDDSLLDLVKRLEQALEPVSVLGSLSTAELAAKCILTKSSKSTQALPEDIALFLEGWKLVATGLAAQLRQDTDAVVKAALESGELYTETLRRIYREHVEKLLRKIVGSPPLPDYDGQPPSQTVDLMQDGAAQLAGLVEARLLPALGRQVKATAPGEGIELLVGGESLRLRHADWNSDNAVDDIAAIQLFGRRSSVRSGIESPAGTQGAVPWYCLTASQYALRDELKHEFKGYDRLTGITATYSDGVLCRELSYRGAHLVARNALQGAHRETMEADPGSSLMFANLDRLPSKDLLAIPLRYGDWYEFAASVVDRAGGMAHELAPTAPWAWDRKTLATLDPPQRNNLQFLRRVPVGECSLRPAVHTSWPQTPENVWLRCLELAESRGEKGGAPTILLAPKNAAFRKDIGAARCPLPEHYAFIVEPPRVDEHTLMRWDMPATTLDEGQRKAAATQLKAAVSDILTQRDARMGSVSDQATKDRSLSPYDAPNYLPFDPAVSAIGVRWEFDDGQHGTLALPARMQEILVQQGVGNLPGAGKADFTVRPGGFLRLGICALVSKVDFARMDEEALQAVLEPKEWDSHHIAFAETVAYVETATEILPELVFERIKLRADGVGDIALSYDFTDMPAAEDALYNLAHQIEIRCERWKWRNLPLPPKKGLVILADDRARRLASGPPPEIVDAALRDDPDGELASSFDALSAIDNGFVLRPDVVKRFPRMRASDTPLHLDSRDAHTYADYLRYSARLISRYAGVLVEVPKPHRTGPRRIATGFRGDLRRIKPPQILAVLPLTQSLEASPTGKKDGGATQFIVILDESWFREYGIGERIEARVSAVKQEIGEAVPPTQLRLGPLPDHSVQPVALTASAALDCFGPFGLSLDRTGSQALANATAFVLDPPDKTPPHYNMFVEFRRLLDLPSGPVATMASDYTEAIPMYTLPDAKLLNAASAGLVVTYKSGGVTFRTPSQFTPFPGAVGGVLTQYRYALISGRKVRDGGRAVDVFMPEDVLWLMPDSGPLYEACWLSGSPKKPFSAGVFVEILLNGRYPFPADGQNDSHALSDAMDLRDLFRRMLHDADRDAPGMIRRVSALFDVTSA